MKHFRNISALALFIAVLTSLGCKKEYLEPFEWYVAGIFNGEAISIEVDRETDAAVVNNAWQCTALNSPTAWNDCDPSFTNLWIEESKFHNYTHATDTPNLAYETSFSLVRRRCLPLPDSIAETWTRDSLWQVGSYSVLDSVNKSNGFIIEFWNGPDHWLSTGGAQPSSSYVNITKQEAITDQPAWKFICEAEFSCTLFKVGSSETMTITNGKYRGRSVVPWE